MTTKSSSAVASENRPPKRRWVRWVASGLLVLLLLAVLGHWIWGKVVEGKLAGDIARLKAKGEPTEPSDAGRHCRRRRTARWSIARRVG